MLVRLLGHRKNTASLAHDIRLSAKHRPKITVHLAYYARSLLCTRSMNSLAEGSKRFEIRLKRSVLLNHAAWLFGLRYCAAANVNAVCAFGYNDAKSTSSGRRRSIVATCIASAQRMVAG